ncbi:hypothetical protein [Spiroplasma endosymbiont of Atherix ibis]|uniref:SLAC1 family transporter n=1 Tax=Spiroplasma endosymbiont of Atherix ibis TaxID=3066291 RepID=UPI0030D168E2
MTLIIIKYLSKPKIFITEFKSPIIGSLIPTLFMASFSWTAFLNSIKVPWLGEIIWLLVLIFFVLYIICFSIYYIKNFSWKSVYPSWFVVWVGIIVFCVTGSTMGSSYTTIGLTVSQQKNFKEFLECLSKTIWYLGFSAYLILLPIVLIKVLFIELKLKSN